MSNIERVCFHYNFCSAWTCTLISAAEYLLACQNRDIDEGSVASSAQGKVMYRKKSDGYFAEYNLSLRFYWRRAHFPGAATVFGCIEQLFCKEIKSVGITPLQKP